jgi:hypothetical protein
MFEEKISTIETDPHWLLEVSILQVRLRIQPIWVGYDVGFALVVL